MIPRSRWGPALAGLGLWLGAQQAAAAPSSPGAQDARRASSAQGAASASASTGAQDTRRASSAQGAGAASAGTTAPSTPNENAEEAAEPEGDAERAKQLFASGAEAFAAQRNAEAIAYFRRAAELVPSAKLTYNIALAYEEMGDSGRALAAYRTYLRQEPEGERRDDVLERIATLERRLAETGVQQLFVTSVPAGATVHVEGRAVGVTPWAGELTPGPHTVELALPGHQPRRADVTLAPEHASELALELTPAPPPAAAERPSRLARVSPLAWTFLGVGAGALAGGLAFELSRASSSAEARDADDAGARAEARGAADAKQLASLLLLGFGAGFTIGGGVVLALDLSGASTAAPSPGDPATDPPAAAPGTADPVSSGGAPGSVPRVATSFTLGCAPQFCGLITRGHF